MADARALQLETAKQILAEVFHARLCDVEDMIMRRLTEKCRLEDGSSPEERCSLTEKSWIKENSKNFGGWGTWPEMFLAD